MSAKRPDKDRALTKAQTAAEVAAKSGLTKAQVHAAFDALADVIAKELKAGRPVAVAGLVKITLVHKAATKARQMPNPFAKGEMMSVKAKPARKVVKVRATKALKDMA